MGRTRGVRRLALAVAVALGLGACGDDGLALYPDGAAPPEPESRDGSADRPRPAPAPLPTPGACPPLSPIAGFIDREGVALLRGTARFRGLGANVYYLQQLYSYAIQDQSEIPAAPARDALEALVCLGMPVARIAAFNDTADRAGIRPVPGVFREEGLRGLDRAIAEAKSRGIRVILVLSNNYGSYGGIPAYATWQNKTHDDFFGDPAMRAHWKEHVQRLATRTNSFTGVAYRDEPAILAWEIANELRCPSCRGTNILNETVRELAQFLRPLVPNQLIGDGGEGFDDEGGLYPGLTNDYAVRGDEGASFSKLVLIPELDLVSYHLYPTDWGLGADRDARIWIDVHEGLARAAGKVAYLGEFGWRPGPPPVVVDDGVRAGHFDRWLDRLFREQDASLGLVWQIIPPARNNPSTNDGYGVVYPDDAVSSATLLSWARAFEQ